MMEYNTKQKKLPLPEYGRSVQKMVDHALTIEDREKRQQCAETIVRIMGSMFPNLPNQERKLWDHLAIMSDFALDIDYPCEVIKKEEFHVAPNRVAYRNSGIKNRHYGRIVEEMIAHAMTLENGEEKEQFIELLLVQMKKNYIAWNKDGVEDRKILEDLRIYSKGAIDIPDREIKLSMGHNGQQRNNTAGGWRNNGKKQFKKKY